MNNIIYKNMSEEKYIYWLINKKKEVEVRLATNEYLDAEYIIFFCKDTKNKFKFKVINKKIFNNFEDCVKYYGHKKLICDTKTNDECIKVYKSFYPNKQYLKNKIVALKLKWILFN